jgi:hypothetical protein
MEIREVRGIFHFYYWRIPSEAVNKKYHLPLWFYLSEEVDIAFQHLWWIFSNKMLVNSIRQHATVQPDEQIFTIIGPALMSSANRVKGFLFEKETNGWLSNTVLLYPVDENISPLSLILYFY